MKLRLSLFTLLLLAASLPFTAFAASPTGHLYLYLDYVNAQNTGTQVGYWDLSSNSSPISSSLDTTNIAVGSHTLTAFYTGGNYPDVTTPPTAITVNANQASLGITVAAAPSTQTQGQAIAVTITLTPQ
jgi:hypothetical protein